jgi:hypothetical protein
MEKIKGEIAFTKDIVDRMEEELDMPREKIEANIDAMIRSMHVRSNEVDCGTMFLPFLGTMYFRVNTVHRLVERLENKGLKLSNVMTNLKNKVKLLRPMLEYWKDSEPQARIERIKNSYVNKGKSVKEIEEFQNKKYNEFKENQKYS